MRQNIKNHNDDNVTLNPYMFRLLRPSVYSTYTTKNVLNLDYDRNLKDDQTDCINEIIDKQLMNVYLNNPEKIKYVNKQLDEQPTVMVPHTNDLNIPPKKVEDILGEQIKEVNVSDLDNDIDDIGIVIKRPNFWKTSGQASFQFTQNYFSDNWYKGGNNNQTLLASIIVQANYNDQRNVTWENKLEMRLGFVTTTSDSCHKFITNNDKLNLHSKLGVKATRSWYYTVTAEANTQFLPAYRANDKKTYSQFMAPFDAFLSVGMDFKPSLKNGNSFSVALLPLSYKWRYLKSHDENIHSVFNMIGKATTKDYGSKMELNAKLKLAKDFYWKCRCYYFTPYSYVEAELENCFIYQFSKYINAEVFTLWRFDDNRDRKYFDDNLGYFQFKEYFTLGLTYSF